MTNGERYAPCSDDVDDSRLAVGFAWWLAIYFDNHYGDYEMRLPEDINADRDKIWYDQRRVLWV